MKPADQTTRQPGTLLHRLAPFLVPASIVYAIGAFLWVFMSEDPKTLWFGIYCCTPMLVIVIWTWVDLRKRRRLRASKLEGEGNLN